MPPTMTPVYSSHVQAIGHDPDTGDLHVSWKGGKTSIYSNVPADLADQVTKSWSVGQAVQTMIKDQFPHRYGG
jgi:hypothetical protein